MRGWRLGTNLDDLGDHRPGQSAAAERGAIFPMVDVGLSKSDVRAISRELQLSTADKPAAACLSSRIAYGDHVTSQLLARIEVAEEALRMMGFQKFRVRAHADGTLARVELDHGEIDRRIRPARRDPHRAAQRRLRVRFARSGWAAQRRNERSAVLDAGAAMTMTQAAPTNFTLDFDRERRQGVPEIVYGPGKTDAEIATIVQLLHDTNSGPILVTRVTPGTADTVMAAVDGGTYDRSARVLSWRSAPQRTNFTLGVVTAGTADGPVADEAIAVATAIGLSVVDIRDVGVAGLHRLMARIEDIHASTPSSSSPAWKARWPACWAASSLHR